MTVRARIRRVGEPRKERVGRDFHIVTGLILQHQRAADPLAVLEQHPGVEVLRNEQISLRICRCELHPGTTVDLCSRCAAVDDPPVGDCLVYPVLAQLVAARYQNTETAVVEPVAEQKRGVRCSLAGILLVVGIRGAGELESFIVERLRGLDVDGRADAA